MLSFTYTLKPFSIIRDHTVNLLLYCFIAKLYNYLWSFSVHEQNMYYLFFPFSLCINTTVKAYYHYGIKLIDTDCLNDCVEEHI